MKEGEKEVTKREERRERRGERGRENGNERISRLPLKHLLSNANKRPHTADVVAMKRT